jgi:hypothetical protein
MLMIGIPVLLNAEHFIVALKVRLEVMTEVMAEVSCWPV